MDGNLLPSGPTAQGSLVLFPWKENILGFLGFFFVCVLFFFLLLAFRLEEELRDVLMGTSIYVFGSFGEFSLVQIGS